MKILIADDDTVSRMILKRALEKLGHEVVATEDGAAAWAVFQKQDVPVLVTDWNMPGMDGLELCSRIRRENRKKYTYIIVITSSDASTGFLSAMDAGADDYTVKPFVPEKLAARLRVAERILRLQQEIKELRIRTCCYCAQMLNENGQWVPGDPSIEKFRNVALSHGVCPACWESRVKPQLDALRKQKQPDGKPREP